MKLIKTKFKGLFILETDKFDDERGSLSKFFDKEIFKFNITQVKYVSTHTKGTIRGMHFQKSPFSEDKIVTCTKGEVYEVVVDIRKGSKTYGKWFGMKFSDKENKSIIIPKGFAHGYQSLTKDTQMLYLMTGKFSKANSFGYRWDDPAFQIKWPLKPTIIAEKDNAWPLFKK